MLVQPLCLCVCVWCSEWFENYSRVFSRVFESCDQSNIQHQRITNLELSTLRTGYTYCSCTLYIIIETQTIVFVSIQYETCFVSAEILELYEDVGPAVCVCVCVCMSLRENKTHNHVPSRITCRYKLIEHVKVLLTIKTIVFHT